MINGHTGLDTIVDDVPGQMRGANNLGDMRSPATARQNLQGVATTLVGNNVFTRRLALTPTASANTDLTLAMPACRILRMTSRTTTAYTGATATVQVGSTAGGVEFVAAVSIKAAATVAHTLVVGALGAMDAFAAGTLYVRIAQTTPTAVGAGILIVEYELT